MGRHLHALGLLVGCALLMGSATASAQSGGVALDQYRAAETSQDGFAISRPGDLGWLTAGAQLHLDYALTPLLGIPRDTTAPAETVVEHLLAARVGGFVGLIDRLVFYASIPVMLVMENEAGMVGTLPPADGAGLGDVELGGRVRLIGEREDLGAIAIQLTGAIPTAELATQAQSWTGENGASFSPEVIGELRFSPVHITANLGFRFRERVTHANLPVQHELTWGLAAGVRFLDDILEIRAEGYGSVGLENPSEAQLTPAEAILGARVYPTDGLVIGLAGGFGIGGGYGTPAFRGVLSVGWAAPIEQRPEAAGTEPEGVDPADPHEPVPDGPVTDEPVTDGPVTDEPVTDEPVTDEPVTDGPVTDGPVTDGPVTDEPPPITGAPPRPTVARPDYQSVDRDGDRVVDAHDRCPIDFEDYDEIQDDDGCPEADADEDEVLDEVDGCPLTPGPARRGRCAGCPELACVDASTGQIDISQRVEFETGEAVLLESSEPVLNAVLSILSTNDQLLEIRVEGHTDDRGPDEENLDLSRRRAESVVRWMVEHGIDRGRFIGFGCGEIHPLSENRSRRGRQANRRVEFLITNPPSGQELREGCQPIE